MQEDDKAEEILRAYSSWVSWAGVKDIIKALLLIALGFGLAILADFINITSLEIAGGVAALWALIVIAFTVYVHRNIVYIVTVHSIRKDSGVLTRRREEISVGRIQSVEVTQSLFERLILKTGSVEFSTAATDATRDDIVFDGVRRPHHIADSIRRIESFSHI